MGNQNNSKSNTDHKPISNDYSGNDVLEILEDAHNYNNFLIQLILENKVNHKNILDFGAGNGSFARAIRDKGNEVSCLEIDNTNRQRLNNDGFQLYSSLDEVMDSSFELIYSLNVLEHIENDSEIISQLYQKLKPGGCLFVYVPAFPILFSEFDKSVGHYRRYKKHGLAKLLIDAGFDVKQSRYADSLGFGAGLIYKYINKNGSINKKQVLFYDKIIFPLSRFFDYFLHGFLGKNVYATALKTDSK